MTMERAQFGTLLKHYREAAALSQEALADRAGLSLDAISALESGRRGRPRLETARRLAMRSVSRVKTVRMFLAAARPREQMVSATTAGRASPAYLSRRTTSPSATGVHPLPRQQRRT